jgi:hypothetical protein
MEDSICAGLFSTAAFWVLLEQASEKMIKEKVRIEFLIVFF